MKQRENKVCTKIIRWKITIQSRKGVSAVVTAIQQISNDVSDVGHHSKDHWLELWIEDEWERKDLYMNLHQKYIIARQQTRKKGSINI